MSEKLGETMIVSLVDNYVNPVFEVYDHEDPTVGVILYIGSSGRCTIHLESRENAEALAVVLMRYLKWEKEPAKEVLNAE